MRGKTPRWGERRAYHHTPSWVQVPLFSLSFSSLFPFHCFTHFTLSLSLTHSVFSAFPWLSAVGKKPDDLRLPSFSLPRLSSLSLLCVVRYVSCVKHHRMMGGRHLLYMQTPPRDHGEAHTVTRAAQWIMFKWMDWTLIRLYEFHLCFWKAYLGQQQRSS